MKKQTVLITAIATLSAAVGWADVPMTADGKPSLQGTWDFKTSTPLNRPERWEDQEFLTVEEAAEYENGILERRAAGVEDEGQVREGLDGQRDVDVGYNSGFLELGTKFDGSLRTSLIVDPPNGRMPAMLDAARLQGIRVPDDIAVAGFDDIPMASWEAYRLTTVRQPLRRMLTQAIRMIGGGDPGEGDIRILPGELKIRGSA